MCRGAVTRPHRHDQGDNSSPTPPPSARSDDSSKLCGTACAERRAAGAPPPQPVHVPIAAAGRPHDLTLVQLEARAVVARLRLLQQAKKPKRPPRPATSASPSTVSASATSPGSRIADASQETGSAGSSTLNPSMQLNPNM
ncbi:hypothetical protein VPH35_063542 [Triticum aestivum]